LTTINNWNQEIAGSIPAVVTRMSSSFAAATFLLNMAWRSFFCQSANFSSAG
jgi:hypothetical protein